METAVSDMSEQLVLLAMRGAIAGLPTEDQAKVKECAAKIEAVVAEYGDHGKFAVGLVGAEMAAK